MQGWRKRGWRKVSVVVGMRACKIRLWRKIGCKIGSGDNFWEKVADGDNYFNLGGGEKSGRKKKTAAPPPPPTPKCYRGELMEKVGNQSNGRLFIYFRFLFSN